MDFHFIKHIQMACVSGLFWSLWIYIKIMKNDRFLSSTLGRPWTLLDNPSDLKFFVVTFIMYMNSFCEFRIFSTTGTLRKNSLFLKKILGRKTKIWYFRGQNRRKSKNEVKKGKFTTNIVYILNFVELWSVLGCF